MPALPEPDVLQCSNADLCRYCSFNIDIRCRHTLLDSASSQLYICNGLLVSCRSCPSLHKQIGCSTAMRPTTHMRFLGFNLSLETIRSPPCLQVFNASGKALRDRINSVKNTQKITDAMKLVAAAKVRRAQDAVVNGRPFSENLVKVYTVMAQHHRGSEPVLNLGQALICKHRCFLV